MSDDAIPDRARLPIDVLDRIDRLCDRFEAAWRRGERPRIEDALGEVAGPYRRALLRDLLASEIAARRLLGESPEPGEYRDRLAGDGDAIASAFAPAPDAGIGPPDPADETVVRTPSDPPVAFRTPLAERPGAVIGPYKLLQQIGEGGMGAVFMAEQERPVRRKVALKVIKAGMDTGQVVARFEAERQALAMMDHPNIARVLDAGATDAGRPFFVMELVRGVPITEYCDRNHLTPAERLELFIPVCQAIQHAHQKGIIHRDIKPSNVLVALHDGVPVAKVIDFGVAKAIDRRLTERTMFTEFGAVIGTLEYMSPEQAEMGALDVDTRSDIYSLGVLLYELLTGSTPLERARLRKAAYGEILRRIREEEPTKPSTRLSESKDALPSISAQRKTEPARLAKLVRGDLDWIVMKSLEKDRTRRYETAAGFARDVRRYLDGDAVEAVPPSASYKLKKFARKHHAALATIGAFALLMIAATAVSSWLTYRAFRAERLARQRLTRAEVAESEAKIQARLAQAQQKRAEDREGKAIDAVNRFGAVITGEPALKNSPALAGLRTRLLREPLAFYRSLRDRLRADRDTRPESLARLADVGFALACLTNDIGDGQDALIAHREAQAIRRELAEANPAVVSYRIDLANSHNNIGSLLQRLGRPAEAMKEYEAGLAIRQGLARADPTAARFQADVAASHNNIAGLLRATGRPAEAIEAMAAAIAVMQRIADEDPRNGRLQTALANGHNNLGRLLSDSGRLAEALKEHRSALAIVRKLADSDPGVLGVEDTPANGHRLIGGVRDTLANSHRLIGGVLKATGDVAGAMSEYRSMLAIYQEQAESNPSVTAFQAELAAGHTHLGNFLRECARPAEAMKEFEAALTIQQKLARDYPDVPDFASELGGGLNNLATLDILAGRFEEARARLRQAVDWQRKALAANPANPDYRRYMANHLGNLIAASHGLGDSAGEAEARRDLAGLHDSAPAIVALDARLASILRGDQQPRDAAERLQLAERAYDKALHATAARLWGEALAADSKLGDDRRAQHRYNAACAAALAGCGRGTDDPKPDDAARAGLRAQALDWLKAELSAWKRVAMTAEPGNRETVAKTLAHWKTDADLAGIRDEAALARLPDEERAAFRQLWEDVDRQRAEVNSP